MAVGCLLGLGVGLLIIDVENDAAKQAPGVVKEAARGQHDEKQ